MKLKTKRLTKSVLIVACSTLVSTSINAVNAEESLSKESGVVTDVATGLQWQDEFENNDGTGEFGSYDEGVAYCAVLSLDGHEDWRMPTQEELLSIVDKSREPHDEPVINKVFENVLTDEAYLSSTNYEDDEETVWTVDYTYGDSTDVALTWSDGYYIRCVRTL